MKLRNGCGVGLVLSLVLVGCSGLEGSGEDAYEEGYDGYDGQRSDDGNSYDPGYDGKNECYDCGGSSQPQRLRLDLSSAVGLAIVDSSSNKTRNKNLLGTTLKVASGGETTTDPAPTDSTDSTEPAGEEPLPDADGKTPEDEDVALYKLEDDGTMTPALSTVEEPLDDEDHSEEGSPEGDVYYDNYSPPVPRVLALGMSPDGSAYVLFEHSFQYREVDPEDIDVDVWSSDSPYTCQLFRSPVNIDPSSPDFNPAADLECVTNLHELPTWRTDRLMQFDRQGRIYFPAMIPGNGREIFYVYDPVTGELDEKVNGNICWHDVEVTPRGSVFYTGTSGSNGDCSGTSFFRYISEDNQLSEIARDYWDFKYLAEQNPEDPDSERIIFYGPDPRSTTQDAWNSACLYRYDPGVVESTDRIEILTDCSSGGWDYVYGSNNYNTVGQTAEDRAGIVDRCQEDGQIFLGGGQSISELAQMADGTLFVAGDFQKKIAGTVSCNLEIAIDHCNNLDRSIVDAESCVAAGAQWGDMADEGCSDPSYTDQGECESNLHYWNYADQGGMWYQTESIEACVEAEGWHVNGVDCYDASNYGNFSENLSGLAFLDPNGDGQLQLLSDVGEEVESFWTINTNAGPEFYYSVYNAGTYSLQRALIIDGDVVRQTVLVDYEIYNVSRDPASNGRILFDGLNFGRNEYQFGSVDPNLSSQQEVAESLQVVEGVTGRIETLIIFPQF